MTERRERDWEEKRKLFIFKQKNANYKCRRSDRITNSPFLQLFIVNSVKS